MGWTFVGVGAVGLIQTVKVAMAALAISDSHLFFHCWEVGG